MPAHILGISAFYHDSAAVLLRDGEIVAAAQEERFTRRKHDPGFPVMAIAYCLAEGGISAEALDYVAFYEKPLAVFEKELPSLQRVDLLRRNVAYQSLVIIVQTYMETR